MQLALPTAAHVKASLVHAALPQLRTQLTCVIRTATRSAPIASKTASSQLVIGATICRQPQQHPKGESILYFRPFLLMKAAGDGCSQETVFFYRTNSM